METLTIKQVDWSHKDACLLRDAQQLEISDLRPIGPGVQANSANVSIFLVAYDGDEPVGCGGLRPLDSQGLPGQAEVKRMYVVPSRRSSAKSQGPSVALTILNALERAAKELTSVRALRKHWRSESLLPEVSYNFSHLALHHTN